MRSSESVLNSLYATNRPRTENTEATSWQMAEPTRVVRMGPRAYWSPAALEVREAQDSLHCLEAAHSAAIKECLDNINKKGRHDCLPQIQVSARWQESCRREIGCDRDVD